MGRQILSTCNVFYELAELEGNNQILFKTSSPSKMAKKLNI